MGGEGVQPGFRQCTFSKDHVAMGVIDGRKFVHYTS